MWPEILVPPRPEKADILYLIKEQALENLRRTTLDDALFVVVVLASALITLVLIKKTLLGNTLQLTRLTIPSFFVAMYILLMSLPATVWFYAAPQNPIRYTYFLAMQSVLISFPIGMFFANALFRDVALPSRIVGRFFSSPLVKSGEDRYAFRVYVIMLALAVLVATVYLLTSGYVPLIGALTAYGQVEGSIVRRSVVAEGIPIHYGHALTARLLLPFCLLYAYFMSYVYGGRWRSLFWPTLGVAAFVSSLTFDRMFPLSVVLFLVLAIYFKFDDMAARAAVTGRRRRRGMYKVRLVGYVAALLFVSMLVGGIVSLTQFNLPMNLEIIRVQSTAFFVNRILLDAAYMAYLYFEEFDTASKFLYGRGFHVLVSLVLGVEFYPTISPSFVASLWVNFGWMGVLVGAALVGFVLQLIQLTVFNRKTVPALSFYIIMLLNGAWIIYGHLLATMVISVYVPSILILMFLKRRRKSAARPAKRIAPPSQDLVPHAR